LIANVTKKKLVAIFLLVEAFVLFGCLVLGVWLFGFCFNFYCMKFGEGGWGNNKGREGRQERKRETSFFQGQPDMLLADPC
jgi:hypothetical protein